MKGVFHLDLVTPEKKILSQEVQMVVAPAMEGDVGILPHHSSMIAMLRAGIVEVQDAAGAIIRYYSDGGYVQMMNNHCIILAEAVVAEQLLTKDLLARQIADLNQQISSDSCDDAKRQKLQSRLMEAQNALLFAH